MKLTIKKSHLIKLASVVICSLLMISSVYVCADGNNATDYSQSAVTEQTVDDNQYYNYYNRHSNDPRDGAAFSLTADKASGTGELAKYDGTPGVALKNIGDYVEWECSVETAGCYAMYINYYPIASSESEITLSIKIDGQSPFIEASSLTLPRIWTNVWKDSDDNSDDVRPEKQEIIKWFGQYVYDTLHQYSEPIEFYLSAGTHTVRLELVDEAVVIGTATFSQPEPTVSYQEYLKTYDTENNRLSGYSERFEAERYVETNNIVRSVSYDRGDAGVYPRSAGYIRYNIISGDTWKDPGESVTWVPQIEKSGLYQLCFRVQQNDNPGLNSYRTLYINGKIPFTEAQSIAFPYSNSWYVKVIGDDNPYLVYLEPGDNITLTVDTTPVSEILANLKSTVLQQNEIYNEIEAITGAAPDVNRDYGLENEIPDLQSRLSGVAKDVKAISEKIKKLMGKSSSNSSTLDEAASLIDSFVDDPSLIPDKLATYKDNISSIAAMILSFSEQPLGIDSYYLYTQDESTPKNTVGFFKRMLFTLERLFLSYTMDYSYVNKSSSEIKNSIDVWATLGRDQAQILKELISSDFEKEHNVKVNLSIVNTSLISAVLAGKGPDVSIMAAQDTPVNLAMRGALMDLYDERFYLDDEFLNQFNRSAFIPFEYNGGLYALPETESFNMMFYRTDVLKKLNLKVPNTWEEFYSALRVIQEAGYEVGILESDSNNPGVSASLNIFMTFLFQQGATVYNSDLTATLYDTTPGFVAFEKWIELYKKYGLTRSFDFYSRFRSGEIVLGITDSTEYNRIAAAAPEISGLWDFAPVPGTVKEDGSIDRSEPSVITGCVLLKAADEHGVAKESFEFMKWWTNAETQTNYGKQLEIMLGTAGRYRPANKVAFAALNWSKEESEKLTEQWKWVQNINIIPGSYLATRSLTGAFRSVVDDGKESRRMLAIYNKSINDEITRKRHEFYLD